MARKARAVAPGEVHLVVLRARVGLSLFDQPGVFDAVADVWASYARAGRIKVYGYSLTKDRLWLIVRPVAAVDLSNLGKAISHRVTRLVSGSRSEIPAQAPSPNAPAPRRESLWQGRFQSVPVPEDFLWRTVLLLEQRHLGQEAQFAGVAWLRSSGPIYQGEQLWADLTPAPGYWSLGNTPFQRERQFNQAVEAESVGGTPLEIRRVLAL
jgi:putative transposase